MISKKELENTVFKQLNDREEQDLINYRRFIETELKKSILDTQIFYLKKYYWSGGDDFVFCYIYDKTLSRMVKELEFAGWKVISTTWFEQWRHNQAKFKVILS